ncbi:MAG: class I SAM-dependent methyltransferase [Thermoflexibacter sp.]
MIETKKHYDSHLAEHYQWMLGDTSNESSFIKNLLESNEVFPKQNSVAIDLGAGTGLQSFVLAKMGYQVIAIDFCQYLLDEINHTKNNLSITTICDDITNFRNHINQKVDLIVCCGDTLTHLKDRQTIQLLIENISTSLHNNGYAYLSFRDYSIELTENQRFIPVKYESSKLLTCFLEYLDDYVRVTDLIHYKTDNIWNLKTSSYKKVRISTVDVVYFLEKNGLKLVNMTKNKGMVHLIAKLIN